MTANTAPVETCHTRFSAVLGRILQRRRNRGGNAETVGAKVSFRPRNNLTFCGSRRLASRKVYEPSTKAGVTVNDSYD